MPTAAPMAKLSRGLVSIICIENTGGSRAAAATLSHGAGHDQGQLQLKRCGAEHFQQEVFVPAASAAFHHDAHAPVGMLFQER